MVRGKERGRLPGGAMAKLIAHVDPTLEDYIEAAARAERVPIDECAGALIQVGWDAVFGFRKSDRFARAASASRQAELRARFVELRAGLPHESAKDRHRPPPLTSPRDEQDQPLIEGDDLPVARHDKPNRLVSRTEPRGWRSDAPAKRGRQS